MRSKLLLGVFFLFGLVMFFTSLSVFAFDYPKLRQEKLVVYIMFQEEEGYRLLDLFKERTGVTYSYLRLPTSEVVTRVIEESEIPKADIILGGTADAHQVLANRGLLEKYPSPVAREINHRFKSPEGYWTGIYLGPVAICINENRWRTKFAGRGIPKPKTLQELLNPAFKDEIIMPDPLTSGTAYTILASIIQLWGEERAIHFFKKLYANVGEYPRSGFTVAQKVATGDYLIGINFVHDQLLMKKAGFNLSYLIPPGAGWEIGCVSMVKNSPNPKAAKAFIDFMVGREAGQLHTNITERISTRTDVIRPSAVQPLTTMPINLDYDFSKAARMKEKYLKLWRGVIEGEK